MTRRAPSQVAWYLLKRTRRQCIAGILNTRFEGADLVFACGNEGGDVELAGAGEGGVGALDGEGARIVGFGAFAGV